MADGKLRFLRHFGPHYGIERFGVSVGILAIAITVFLVTGGLYVFNRNQATDAATSVYETSFSTSASKQTGNVKGAWRSSDGTRFAVLCKFDDMSKLTTDASKYRVTVAGIDGFGYVSALSYKPGVAVYSYGDSGYILIFLTSSKGFPREKVGFSIDMGLVKGTSNDSNSSSDANKLATTDTWTLTVNPGANDIADSKALDSGDTFDPVRFYTETVSAPAESDARAQLSSDAVNAKVALSAIAEYQSRLEADGVDVKSVTPSWVAGDGFSMDGDKLTWTQKTTLPNGLQIPWGKLSLDEDGYMATAMKATGFTSEADFMSSLKDVDAPTTGQITWRFTNGGAVGDLTGTSSSDATSTDSRAKSIKNNIDLLTTAWSNYGSVKAAYEGADLQALFEIEYDAHNVGRTYTSTTSNDGNVTFAS